MPIKNNHLKHFLIYFFSLILYSPHANSDHDVLTDLSVEDLLNIEVISTSKKAKSLNNSPAAIFVITQNDINRIGATSIPEALRLAPGLDVSRIDSNKWAVSARGFNGRFSNKLLVLIDGRSIYTRAFSGVYWENNGVMMEDVERIEVIRGPGATLWGANAVNGVINIITKHSADTQGGLLIAGGGTKEQGFGAFRYGSQLNANTTAKAYIKGFKRDENTLQSGGGAGDNWDKVQGGFRLDSQLNKKDSLTLQGDAYRSAINQKTTLPLLTSPYQSTFNETIDSFGGNLLGRHQHIYSPTSEHTLQIYYDFYERNETIFKENRHIIDIDFQHRFSWLNWNDFIWGVGYRYNHDNFSENYIAKATPSSRNNQLFSAFLQDEITLINDALWLTLGSKVEHNDYSGFEYQPTARLMWIPHHQHRLWGAISRAVRTPSRLDHDISILVRTIPTAGKPVTATFSGTPDFNSEKVISYELGYRTTFIDNVSIDLTSFYNEYWSLISSTPQPLRTNPSTGLTDRQTIINNQATTTTYGFEIATVWQMLEWWRWDANYSLLKTKVADRFKNDFSPQQRVSLRSSMSLKQNIDLDILFRYVDSSIATGIIGTTHIKDYVSLDLRLAWHPVNNLELSLVGQNLLAGKHLEYRQEFITSATEIDRGMYGKMAWSF